MRRRIDFASFWLGVTLGYMLGCAVGALVFRDGSLMTPLDCDVFDCPMPGAVTISVAETDECGVFCLGHAEDALRNAVRRDMTITVRPV